MIDKIKYGYHPKNSDIPLQVLASVTQKALNREQELQAKELAQAIIDFAEQWTSDHKVMITAVIAAAVGAAQKLEFSHE